MGKIRDNLQHMGTYLIDDIYGVGPLASRAQCGHRARPPLGPSLTGILGDDTSREPAKGCWPGVPDPDDDDRSMGRVACISNQHNVHICCWVLDKERPTKYFSL